MAPSLFAPTLAARDRRFGYGMAAPAVLVLAAIILAPVALALATSLFDYTMMNMTFDTFIWFDNFASAIDNAEFANAMLVTTFFVVAVVALEFVIGFVVALMLSTVKRGKNVYYLILLIPLLINPVVVGLIWRMLLHPTLGIVNWLLGGLGIPDVDWLGQPTNAFWTVVLVDIWHQVSFMAVLLTAGLSALPTEPFEAARAEGAGTLQTFWFITLPLMRPVIAVTLLIRLIFAIKTYDLIYIMTRGGPGDATDLISYYIYRSAFARLNLGEAAAMALILMVIVIVLTLGLFRAMRERT
ncbi:MAG: sugar ABC transporter permease [Alphaproteobacteria bacterium]